MITDLFRASLIDFGSAIKDAEYFSLSQSAREKRVGEVMSKDYPANLRKVAFSIDEQEFVREMYLLGGILAEANSVIERATLLSGSSSKIFEAFLKDLPALREYQSDGSALGRTIRKFNGAGPQYKKTLDRELQQLLLFAKNQDSPIYQTALPLEGLSGIKGVGVPSVEVSRALLGGARRFYDGELVDDSWRARLTSILKVIS